LLFELVIFSEILKENNFNTISLDINNLSFIDEITHLIYDWKEIPFNDNTFDIATILTVLHHTLNPEEILKEVSRVSKQIVIIEDIYTNKLHKYITFFLDSLFNLEFLWHPHTNKTDKQWQDTFSKMWLKILKVKYNKSFIFFRHATYHVVKV